MHGPRYTVAVCDDGDEFEVETTDEVVEATASSEAAGSEAIGRVLALDVGDRRIGLAMSDPLGYTAQPMFTLQRTSQRADLKSIARVIRKHGVTDVVVGLPLHSSGEMSTQAAKSQAFAEGLREQSAGVRVHLLDERLTTSEAHSLLDGGGRGRSSRSPQRAKIERRRRTAIIDQVAAVLLLEAFLSARSPRLLPGPP